MGKVKIRTPKDCMDSRKVLSFAKQEGVNIREAKGSHFRMEKDSKYETGVHGNMSIGVATKIWKFFKACGLLFFILAIISKIYF